MQNFADTIPSIIISVISTIAGAVIGAAYAPLRSPARPGIHSIHFMIQVARSETDWGIVGRIVEWIRRESRKSSDGSGEGASWLLAGGALLVVVALYAEHAEAVAATLIMLAVVAYGSSVWSLMALRRQGAVGGWSVANRLILGFVLAGVGVVNAVFSVHPVMNVGAREEYIAEGFFGSSSQSWTAVLFLFIGAVLTVASLLTSVSFSLASSTAVHVARGTFGRPIWRVLFYLGRWSTDKGTFAVVTILGILSLFLSTGWAAHLFVEAVGATGS